MAPGTRLGPYEILAPLGAGGMGEVYRAHDSRLDRTVAIKVLPAAFSRDAERLRRFEQEARATAALNHPNILAVFDIGTHEDSPYVVTELLEGETLRHRTQSGPLSVRKATDYALQSARGIAAAHDRGIVHRDLKPENIFLTRDGRIKILDFGLAKLTRPHGESSGADTPTLASQTEPGLVLGTVGYMSPEQVRGKPADARSDIFSLGAILYEMVSGKRAFHDDTAADTMTAILKGEPPPLSDVQQNVPPGLVRTVEHCLEKDPDSRFQSARDVVFSLEAFSGSSSTGTAPLAIGSVQSKWHGRSLLIGLGIGLLVAFAAFVAARKTASLPPPPAFHQLTFQRGYINNARFAPDGETIIYAASWAGKPFELFSTRPEGTESRSLGLPDSDLLAVSSTGELAVRLAPRNTRAYSSSGTLARTMLSGGSPRPIENEIQFADWTPDGKDLAIVHQISGRSRLELPIGTVLFETAGWIGDPRVSPKGDLVAFIDHPGVGGDPGSIAVTDRTGHKRELSSGFVSAGGLAWSPQGDEVWFTATRTGNARALYGVSLSGKERLITRIPGILNLRDVSRSGRVLLSRDEWRLGIIALAPGSNKEQDLSWMDFSAVRDLSPDGKLLLFDESGEAGGILGAIYLRKIDGSPPVRLGDGTAASLSFDSRWVLSIPGQLGNQFVLLPTGTGAPRTLAPTPINNQWANLLPNGREVLFAGNEPGHGVRIYLQDVSDGKLRPITPEGVALANYTNAVSPDGRFFLSVEADDSPSVRSVESGERKPIPGLSPGDFAFGWNGNGRSVYVYKPSVPARVYQVELASGHRQLWRELSPPDPAGVNFIRAPHISADGKAYAYNYNRILSDLYLVDGLR
jgi:eukaryotic-like serine/threonine-protein kinase